MKFWSYTFISWLWCLSMSWLCAQTVMPFWTEDFSGAQIPMGWTNEDASGNDALWEYCSTEESCLVSILNENGQLYETAFQAITANNGFVWMNSDTLGNLPSPHLSQLTTNAINCEGRDEVWVSFYSQITTSIFAPYNNAVLRVATSNTPETEWTDFLLYNNLIVGAISSRNPQPIKFDISEVAANQSTVYIQWQWRGELEQAWLLDDVALYDSKPSPANALWYEDFCNGIGDWEIQTELNDIPWAWHPSGNMGHGVFSAADHYLHSPTAYNGVALLDYDFLITNGDPANIPNFPYPLVKAEFISPTIDLSDITTPLDLEFYQLIRRLNAVGNNAFSSVAVSIDNGNTWETSVDVNPFLFTDDPPLDNKIYMPLVDIEGEPAVKIKFTYHGDFFYWVIDDITLIERPDYDLMMETDYFAIPPNYSTPFSQISPIPFLANFKNIGKAAQDSVLFSVCIKKEEESLFQTQNLFHSVAANAGSDNNPFEEMMLFSNTPNSKGNYRGIYRVKSPNKDFRPENDSLDFIFEISDTTFAKENGPAGNITSLQNPSYSIGNVFYVPNGMGWYARYISFSGSEPPGVPIEGKRVDVLLYEWDGNSDEEFTVNAETDMELIAFYNYEFRSGDGDKLIDIPILDETPLNDDTYYLPVIRYNSVNEQVFPMSINRNFNYHASRDVSNDLGKTHHASAVDIGNNGRFNLAGFEPVFSVIPVIRLHIGDNPDLNTPPVFTKNIALSSENKIMVHPNPLKAQLNISIDLVQPTEKLWIKIFNIHGQIVFNRHLKHFQKGNLSYAVHKLPRGTYFLQILTPEGSRTKKLIIH